MLLKIGEIGALMPEGQSQASPTVAPTWVHYCLEAPPSGGAASRSVSQLKPLVAKRLVYS